MRSIGAGDVAAARQGAAGISTGADHPSSMVHPESATNNFAKKEISTSASSRSAAPPAGAGRPASELGGIGAASRARVSAAKVVNAAIFL